jgi:hypothetical protein
MVQWSIVGGSVAWAAALPLATFAASRPHNGPVTYLATLAVYGAGSLICHQLPERSFHLWTAQMPVCARCTGIYVGAAIAAIVSGFRVVRLTATRLQRCVANPGRPRSTRRQLLVAALPALTTLLFEWTTGQTPANWIRAATGVCLGAVTAAVVFAYAQDAERPEGN